MVIRSTQSDRVILCVRCNRPVNLFTFTPGWKHAYTGRYRAECHGEVEEGELNIEDFVQNHDTAAILSVFKEGTPNAEPLSVV